LKKIPADDQSDCFALTVAVKGRRRLETTSRGKGLPLELTRGKKRGGEKYTSGGGGVGFGVWIRKEKGKQRSGQISRLHRSSFSGPLKDDDSGEKKNNRNLLYGGPEEIIKEKFRLLRNRGGRSIGGKKVALTLPF